MSASLVGSEMCIRDRGVHGLRAAGRRSGRGGLAMQRHAVAPSGRRGAAVSYTHLTLPTICSV
eukprot:2150233-Alexandrium_andersonii.AAC.1